MAAEDPRSAKRRVESPAHTHAGAAGHATYHSAVVRQAVAFDAVKEVFPDLSTAFLTHLPQDEAVHMFKNVSRKRAVAYLTKPALLGIMENSLMRMLPVGDKRLGIKNSSLTKAHSLSVDGGKSVRYDWPEHVMDWVGIPAFEAALKQGIAQNEEWRAFVVASDRAPKIAGVGPRRPTTPVSAATKPKAAATASETHASTQNTQTGTQQNTTNSTHDHGNQARLTPSKHDSTHLQATAVQPAGGDEAKTKSHTEEHTHARHPHTHPDATQPGPSTHTHIKLHPQPPAHRPSASSVAAAAAVTLAASTPSTTTQDATTTHNDTQVSDASRDEGNPVSTSTASSASSSSMAGQSSAPTAAAAADDADEAPTSSSSALSSGSLTQSPTAKGPCAAAETTSGQAEGARLNGSTTASTTDSAQSSVRDEKETLTPDGTAGDGGGGVAEDDGRVSVGGKQAKRRASGSGVRGENEAAKVKDKGERQGKQGKGKAGEAEGSSAGNKRKRQMLSATEFLASTTSLPSSSAQPRKRTATSSPPRSTAASSNKSALPKRPPVGAKRSATQLVTKGASTSSSSSSTSRSSTSGDAKSDKGAGSTATRGRKRPPMPTRSQQVKEEGGKTPNKAGLKAEKEAETSGEARGGAEGGRGDGGRGGSNSRGKKRGHNDVAPRTKDACNGRDEDHHGEEAIPVRGVGRKTANSLAAAVNATLGRIAGIKGTGSGKSPRAKKPKTSSSSSSATTTTTPPPAAASSSSSSSSSSAAGGKGGSSGGGEVAPMNVVDDVDDYMVSVRKELLGLTRGGTQELTHVALRAFHALVNGDKAMVVALQTAKSMEMPVSEVALNILVGLERAKATPSLDPLPYTHHVPPNPPTSNPPTSVSTPPPASPAV